MSSQKDQGLAISLGSVNWPGLFIVRASSLFMHFFKINRPHRRLGHKLLRVARMSPPRISTTLVGRGGSRALGGSRVKAVVPGLSACRMVAAIA